MKQTVGQSGSRRFARAKLRGVPRLGRDHWPLVVVLAAGAVVRLLAMVAYRPGLFFGDSWGYLAMAAKGFPVGIAPTRPSGYPLTIKVVSLLGGRVGALTFAQHLAGLATATLVYALLVRSGVRRSLATLGAALVVLDSYAIALEQYVLAEAFFTLCLTASLYLAISFRRSAPALAASGLLLAFCATMRPDALFAIPAWLIYVAFTQRTVALRVLATAAVAAPLALYATAHAAVTGEFGLTQSDGWFLYGRVARLADCSKMRVEPDWRGLCSRGTNPDQTSTFYLWGRDSPARVALGGISADPARQNYTNSTLRAFSLAVIESRPLAYAQLVLGDSLRYFEPKAPAQTYEEQTVAFPSAGRLDVAVQADQVDRWAPGYAPRAYPPASALHGYQRWFHLPRVLLGALLCAVGAFLAAALSLRRRSAFKNAGGVAVLAGAFVSLLVGSVAISDFALRYVLPAVPLLVCAAILSFDGLLEALPARLAPPFARRRS